MLNDRIGRPEGRQAANICRSHPGRQLLPCPPRPYFSLSLGLAGISPSRATVGALMFDRSRQPGTPTDSG